MNLSAPDHICGQLRGPGANARRAERRDWISARIAEGQPLSVIANALEVCLSVVAKVVRANRAKAVEPASRIVVQRRNVRSVAVPFIGGGGGGQMTVVSLPRLPWETPEGRISPRPETEPPRAPRNLAKLTARPQSAYQRVRAAIEEVAEL